MKYFIVINAQNDFVTGSLANKRANEVVPGIRKAIDKLDNTTMVVFTRDSHVKDTYMNSLEGKYLSIPHCYMYSPGWEVDSRLTDGLKRTYIMSNNGTFGDLRWEDTMISPPSEIHICGFCTDICVISNALILRAMYPNIKIVCHENFCAGTSQAAHRAAIEIMKNCLIDIDYGEN